MVSLIVSIALILLITFSTCVDCVQGARGEGNDSVKNQQRQQRRSLMAKQNANPDYYVYSQGRGGVAKQQEIPDSPSIFPSPIPSIRPSPVPSTPPSGSTGPSEKPSSMPSASADPSNRPSGPRSAIPSPAPSDRPSFIASVVPSQSPSQQPSNVPSVGPSREPSNRPSVLSPSALPSISSSSYSYSYDDVSISYTTLNSSNWPDDSIWQSDLASRLSANASLTNNIFIDSEGEYDAICEDVDTVEEFRQNAVCQIQDSCQFQFCNLDEKDIHNIPPYTVEVRTPNDIMEALGFAEKYNIQVSIKTTGHNFASASYRRDSLNIFMANYPKDGTIKPNFQDTCGTFHNQTIGINGGEVWGDVILNFKDDYHILSGDTRSVSAAGGWLQGVGLSHTSRMYGLGIDNVLSFDVILPDSKELVTADACTNPDLFWALRGGGGGTFGVVVHTEYKLLPKSKITTLRFWMYDDTEYNRDAVQLFLSYWARVTPILDRRVGGAWFRATNFEVYVVGDFDVATDLFFSEFTDWYDNEFIASGFNGTWRWREFESWYDYMGGEDPYEKEYVPTGQGRRASTRIIPHDMVVSDAPGVIEFLVDLHFEVFWGAYWLGGAVNDIPAGVHPVHPAMRTVIWAISTTSKTGERRLREYLPNNISGCSFNHQGMSEPGWRSSLWGDDNYKRLLGIKNRYDPNRRLNCWHCVGYQGLEYESS